MFSFFFSDIEKRVEKTNSNYKEEDAFEELDSAGVSIRISEEIDSIKSEPQE